MGGGMLGEEDEERWSEELRSSVGVVTDLVLPCHHAAGSGAGAVDSLVEAEFDSEEDDENEREMAAALEVSTFFCVLTFIFFHSTTDAAHVVSRTCIWYHTNTTDRRPRHCVAACCLHHAYRRPLDRFGKMYRGCDVWVLLVVYSMHAS